jgi:AcrR family transcriptional regulator
MSREYTLGKRAEQQNETRRRIVEATVELHQEIGGLNTTISAIAERAGVERATVYRYFPDERSLLEACTSHYVAENPPPNPMAWLEIASAHARLEKALVEIYAYHRRTEAMSARAASDLLLIPLLEEVLAPLFAYWQQVQVILATPWQGSADEKRMVEAMIGHAITFQTWQSLVRRQGLDDVQAAKMMCQAVCCMTSR